MESDEIKQIVEDDIKAAEKLNIRSTPNIFINGKPFDTSKDLTTIILAEMNKVYPQN